LTIEDRVTGISEAAAALERGRPILVVVPPAVEQAEMVWELLAVDRTKPDDEAPAQGPRTIIVCTDRTAAEDWADSAPSDRRVHPVTALDRSARLVKTGQVGVLAGTPEDLNALAARSALKLDTVSAVVLAWPEWLQASARLSALEQLLAELRDAHRVVLAWDPTALEDLLERYARRPHVVGDLPLGEDARPLPPVGPARYAVVVRARRRTAVREVLDALDRPRVTEWRRGISPEAADAIICLDLPSRAELAQISAVATPVLLLSPDQVPYARNVARPLTPLPLDAGRARAQSRADALRSRAEARIEAGGLEPELCLLQPLLARYDAAEVAAAVLAISHQPSADDASRQSADGQPPTAPQAWVRLFVNVGRKDKVGPKDLVGALTREVGLARDTLGRIEVRETFSLVDVTPEVIDRAQSGLARVTIRGRRVAARRDRET
jgi:DbpA RNA binding domain